MFRGGWGSLRVVEEMMSSGAREREEICKRPGSLSTETRGLRVSGEVYEGIMSVVEDLVQRGGEVREVDAAWSWTRDANIE